jgi:hypothetical protein
VLGAQDVLQGADRHVVETDVAAAHASTAA